MMKMSVCPYCRSRTPEGATCAYCGSPLGERDVEVHFPALVSVQKQRLNTLLGTGIPIAAATTFISPFLTGPLHFLVSVPILVMATGMAVNSQLVFPVQWLLSRPRRFLARWTRRLCFYSVAFWGFAVAVTPIVGALAGAATFAGLSVATHRYMMWNAKLDFEGTPIRGFERVILIGAGITALVLAAIFVTVTALLAWLVSSIAR